MGNYSREIVSEPIPFLGEVGEADCCENTISQYKCDVKCYSFVTCIFSMCLAVVWLLGYAMPQANSDVSNLPLHITQCFSLQALANSKSGRVFVACMSQSQVSSSHCCVCRSLELSWIKSVEATRSKEVVLITRYGKQWKCSWCLSQFLKSSSTLLCFMSDVLIFHTFGPYL